MGVNADAKAKLEARIKANFRIFYQEWQSCIRRMELCLERGDSRAAIIALSDFANRAMPWMIDRDDPVFDIPDQPQEILSRLDRAGFHSIDDVRFATDDDLMGVNGIGQLQVQKLRASIETLLLRGWQWSKQPCE